MEEGPSRKLAVLLHADVVGSTALVQLNETLAHQRIQDTFRRFSETIVGYAGTALEIRGDAVVAEFSRASDAVSAALAFQAENVVHNDALTDRILPEMRVGIAMGEVVIADSTVTGEGVVLAQRLEQLAAANGVVVQGSVTETVPTRLPFEFESLGEQLLKGFEQPVRAFVARLKPGMENPAPESAMRASTTSRGQISLELPDKPSIAVLPFDNMSADPDQEHFSDGICEDIITALSKIPKLLVVARNSTFTYKGRAVDVKEVGLEQGVRYVLEGSVRRSGDRLRITAQLIDATSGHHVWAQRYDRVVQDVFELQDEITREVTASLQVELTDGEQARLWASGTQNLEAWETVIQITDLLQSHQKNNLLAARRLAGRALQLDENYASAWAYLGWTHWEEVFNSWSESPDKSLKLAVDAAERSRSIDDSNPNTIALLAFINLSLRNFDLAFELGERAVALGPNDSFVAGVAANVALFCNKPHDMLLHLKKAMRLCPICPAWYPSDVGWAYLLMGRREDAITQAQMSSKIDPDYPFNYILLSIAFAELDQTQNARAAVDELLRVDPSYTLRSFANSQPFRDPEVLERHLEGLRKAGLPE